ncbi:Pyridine nucleotide-disulfide oxidoreductase dimerization region OS=Tsukamurella paurometabola (strain ATCC 8368 / DSM / CCUG 35730 / CIP 100753 / JCM 10117/ KCTC 9821 / NBRC 16120 / NCIMB 702349 / NCTC 13040) OX=521096 GN=Tpau_2717 PE=3 SV=1 [Tsukamurella paurometabola]|uniref:Pyridine nucleotide-disulfide oxidoreductase dimerization region n=1 Tax=Tsukamurella paurometabola (strain ATCC 8368 / DSM 20162 / CCUG 35730 / CIP 100753 / JCM 10117 / KCTC 9821 / NBRC 16120 / NCIMB 702349 / NCTC 13040) TaxID=521096 RepID=D5USP4_TSUPD|nr:NAD(P)/FAD-dependent oxidoreductase [Tsukamurella paurometabola]ADG79315.1 pyridine nucleotide-disulfide oxidoreductase dimerization region [Tsukamurella paurometabola DSM 20162]SUP35052.1 Mercuric reductase [Tsukamurella paurometabola]
MSAHAYDVIVIGAGPVGENVADRAVRGGLSAVLIESELVGGECSYWACMPSKALLRPGQAVAEARRVRGAAEAVIGTVDPIAVLARRNTVVHDWSDEGQVGWAEGAGISVIRGRGRLSGPKTVTVTAADGTESTLAARHAVVVATGTDATVPPVDGLRDVRPWTSREATSAKQVPGRLAVIGGGVVAAEMATAYASLGSTVTMVVRSGLLANMEPFVGALVGDALREQGVEVLLGTSPSRVTRAGEEVTIETSDGRSIVADEVLVATGRSPRTADIGLESVGLEPGSWLSVDETMLVDGFDWLYAVGDVNHRALLTHQGKYQARAAGDVIAARANGEQVCDGPWGTHAATADHTAVPQVVFTDPEVASVGLTEAAARAAGHSVTVADYDLGWVAGASLYADGYAGRARMIVDGERGVLLGATLVGSAVAELLHAATIAVVGEVPIDRLWHAVPAYPTISEVWLRLLETYRDR